MCQNAVTTCAEQESIGIDVVFAQDSLMVDNDFFKLMEIVGLQYLSERPPCLESGLILGIAYVPLFVYGYANRKHPDIQTQLLWCLIDEFIGMVFGFL